ncbi:MAG TPA: universal stress protein [Thermoanaerobaculia bacterium]|nr:universal stress protein [Thermoanaerobaculia bacterium]
MDDFGFRRILVPTDLSDFAALALRYAAAIRERAGSELTLLYADETYLPVDLLEAPLGYYLENAPRSREQLQAKFSEYAKAQIGGKFETVVVQDSPARAILNTAKSVRPDLIIMGTHGRSGVRRALLGSVTENVLHEVETPLLTITPMLMGGRETAIQRILCPVNFTYIAREALREACKFAQLFDAELSVMYVVEGIPVDKVDQVESAFLQWVDPQLRNQSRFTRLVARDGDPAERVLAAAFEQNSDLIVVGAQHKFFSDATIIGTTTQRITRFARCPVLTVARKAKTEVFSPSEEKEAALVS